MAIRRPITEAQLIAEAVGRVAPRPTARSQEIRARKAIAAEGRREIRTPREAAMLLKARFASAQAQVQAGFDAAASNSANTRHWQNADGLSADAAASPWIRQVLRERARYEVANNSYARGMLETLAMDTVGTGPRLQMLEGSQAARLFVATEFGKWARRIRLAAKLRTMRVAKCEDGEAFGVMFMNPFNGHQVPLDLNLIEADQVCTPDQSTFLDPNAVDGIRFDAYRNPLEYHVLREHPGTDRYFPGFDDYDRVSASLVLHYFRADRPGQSRGIPEISPALPIYNQLRRYTLAVLAAAEKAALIAGVIKSNSPPQADNGDVTPFETIDLDSEWKVMPEGWDISQLKAEQPTTTYPMGKWEFIGEAARCLNMPINIAMGNSSKHNYASGRLDHQVYHRAIWIERDELEMVVVERIFDAWFSEALLVEGYLPGEYRSMGDQTPMHRWFWDGFEHVDPVKEASAQQTRLANNTTNLAEECAAQGLDWREVLEQRAEELRYMRELGIQAAASHDNTGRPIEQPGPEEIEEDEPSLVED